MILNQIVLILYHIIISFDTIDTNYIAVSRCVHAISCRALRVPAGNPNDFKESSFIPGHLDIGHRLAPVAPKQLSSISLGQNYSAILTSLLPLQHSHICDHTGLPHSCNKRTKSSSSFTSVRANIGPHQ